MRSAPTKRTTSCLQNKQHIIGEILIEHLLKLSILFFVGASAQSSTYSCEFVDDVFSEFTVEINMKSKKAAIWNLETWVVVPMVKEISVNSPLVIFAGQDSSGDSILIQFDASDSMMRQHLAIFPGVPSPGQEIACRLVAVDQLGSGI
jgi:hypothetical protein